MRSKICCFIFFLFFTVSFHAQDTVKIDSLTSLLQKTGNDTSKVNILIALADEYALPEPKKSLEYSQEALKLAENLKWKKGIALSYSKMGYAYYKLENFTAGLECNLKTLKLMEELHDQKGICDALEAVGNSYNDLCNFAKAIKYYIQSLQLAEKTGAKERIVSNLSNLAKLHNGEGNYNKALDYYDKSLKLALEYGYKKYVATNQGNMGGLFMELGKYTDALGLYFTVLEFYNASNDKRNVAAVLGNIACTYQLQSDSANRAGNIKLGREKNNKALEYFLKALKASEDIGNEYLQATFLGNIGAINITEKHFADAEEYLESSLRLALKINAVDEIQMNYQRFCELYKQTNQPAKALEYYEKYVAVKDSIFNETTKKAILDLQTKYETEKKENEIKTLTQKNKIQELKIINIRYIVFGVVSLFAMALILGFLLIRHNRIKSQKQLAQFEQRLLRTQMNPHFIFNSLISIESFIYEHQPKEAGAYLSNFARLMRNILENSNTDYISLQKEIESLNFYLSLQKLRLNDNLDYHIEVDDAIITGQVYLPPMLTRPFIENAIEHGFRGIKQNGFIRIHFMPVNNHLQIEITDNGIGREQAQQQKELHLEHRSMAMQITKERLKFLNRSLKQKEDFTVTDLSDNQNGNIGTKIVFTIPLISALES